MGPALPAGVVDDLPGDEPGVLGGQESDDAGRVGRLADPAEGERRARRRFLFGCHLSERTGHRAAAARIIRNGARASTATRRSKSSAEVCATDPQ
jgi:hypothetical protein